MPKKILIVEDNPLDARIVKDLIENGGFKVTVASTGKEGVEKAIEIRPDLVILDLILPDINGFEVCRSIRKAKGMDETIVVILTIRDNPSDINEAFRAGADDFIMKPIVPEFLVRKIKLYLGVRS